MTHGQSTKTQDSILALATNCAVAIVSRLVVEEKQSTDREIGCTLDLADGIRH